jgi:membrane-bound serine protease (ClpP class)
VRARPYLAVLAASLALAAVPSLRGVAAAEPAGAAGEEPDGKKRIVYVIPIEDGPQIARGMVDPWQSFFVARNVDAAKEAGADAIIFKITTYGGLVDSAIEITSTITSVESIPTVAFVVDRAISAGALIAVACDKIYMEEGSQMGSAQAISTDSQGNIRTAEEKFASVMRARFKLLAQQNGRNTALAEAMTDPELTVLRIQVDGEEDFILEKELNALQIEMDKQEKTVEVIDTAVAKGELLNMTYKDAFEKFHFIDGVVTGRADLLEKLGLADAIVIEDRASWPQETARFLGGPVIGGILILIGILALFIEIATPAKGIGGLVFLFAMGLFFWAHFLGGQAGAVEIVLFLLGVVLLALEAFVIPGFGIAGFSGIALVVASLVMSFIPNYSPPPGVESLPFDWGRLQVALFTVLVSFGGSIVGLLVLARYLPRAPFLRNLMLEGDTGMGSTGRAGAAGATGTAALAGPKVGDCGVATTDLRPAGKVEIEGKLVDAVTQAEFIEKGRAIRVLEVDGFRVVVALSEGGGKADGGGEA